MKPHESLSIEPGQVRDLKQEDQEIEKYLKNHHSWKHKPVSEADKISTRHLIVKTQRYVRASQASKQMFNSPSNTYWDVVDEIGAANGRGIKIPPHFHPTYPRHQLARLSYYNLQRLLDEVGILSDVEEKFWHIFTRLNFDLTHYTQRSNQIISSGRILSHQRVQEMVKGTLKLSNSSLEDLTYLCNGNYVFFRFEVVHDVDKESRFGKEQLIFDAKNTGFLETGWISLVEMLHPRNISIIESLEYKGSILRSLAEAESEEDSDDEKKSGNSAKHYSKEIIIPFNYLHHTSGEEKLNIVQNIFNGPDILPGLTLAIIKEMRLIGGVMQKDFKALIAGWTTDMKSENYHHNLTQLNIFLNLLFRVEAKFPAAIYLDQKYYLVDGRKIKNVIARDDVETLSKILPKADLNQLCVEKGTAKDDKGTSSLEVKIEKVTPLIAAAINGSTEVVTWLLQQGADPIITDQSGKTYQDYIVDGLINSIEQGELPKIKSFFAHYPHVLEEVDVNHNNPLLFAAYKQQALIVKYLLSIGAKATHVNKSGDNYLSILADCAIKNQKENRPRVFDELTQHFPEIFMLMPAKIHPDLRYENIEQHMFYCIKLKRNNDFQLIFKLFPMFANTLDQPGNNYIIYATMVKNFKIASWLLNQPHHKKDTRNILDHNYLYWLLIHSIEYIKTGQIQTVLSLLEQFPQFHGNVLYDEKDPDQSNKNLLSLAMRSLQVQNQKLVCKLLEKGADPTKLATPGHIYHFLAKTGKLVEIKNIYQQAPFIPVDLPDDNHNTPLIYAIIYQHFQVALWLLEKTPIKSHYKQNLCGQNYYDLLILSYNNANDNGRKRILKLFPLLKLHLNLQKILAPPADSKPASKISTKRKVSFLETGSGKRQNTTTVKPEVESRNPIIPG